MNNENWKDFVGYQPLNGIDQVILYLVTNKNSDKIGVTVSCESHRFTEADFTIDESNIVEAIKDVLNLFPKKQCLDSVELRQAKNAVAFVTRRGVPNKNCGNVWWYSSVSDTDMRNADSPIIVSSLNGKYAIFKHPKFMDYGFVAITS